MLNIERNLSRLKYRYVILHILQGLKDTHFFCNSVSRRFKTYSKRKARVCMHLPAIINTIREDSHLSTLILIFPPSQRLV